MLTGPRLPRTRRCRRCERRSTRTPETSPAGTRVQPEGCSKASLLPPPSLDIQRATRADLLPRAEEAFGIREKLAGYSLDPTHERGRSKARGFAAILGITIDSIDYLEAEIRQGVQRYPIKAVVDNPPYGWNYVVDFPLWGIGHYSGREANVRTVWELIAPDIPLD
jgi:hypothetical protein